ncbi:MAG: hypothetical protein U1E17_16650 [Geminicoccaceae bacterium]
MAKLTAPQFNLPQFKLPELKLPKFDLNALLALQTANLVAVHEAQNVVLEAIQAVVKSQAGYAEELVAEAKGALTTKEPKQAEAMLADVKAAAEKAVALSKQNVDLSLAAQRKVADLVAQRVQANVNELKALAA